MRTSNALITFADANIMGLYPLAGSPPSTNDVMTKADLNQWFYIDNTIEPLASYANNRCPRYQDVLSSAIGTLPNFYQYDVTRSGIPGVTGAYFTYLDPYGYTQTIMQNSYGYVGRFCMQENSYINNQWSIYQISLAGVCYPDNQGTTYPHPDNPQYLDTYFSFTISPGYEIRQVAIYNSAGGLLWITNGVYSNSLYLDSNLWAEGIVYVRYFVYTTSGTFVQKFGFPGYPAYKVYLLQNNT